MVKNPTEKDLMDMGLVKNEDGSWSRPVPKIKGKVGKKVQELEEEKAAQYQGNPKEVVIDGQRTADSLEEMYERGLLDFPARYEIYGDATGRHRDTRSKVSDWDIIDNFFANITSKKAKRPLRYKIEVGRSNPPVRTRHNHVNGVLCNANNKRRLMVYKDCPTVDEGLRLTKLKSGAQYLEDDTDRFQHITTALGYAVCGVLDNESQDSGVFNIKR